MCWGMKCFSLFRTPEICEILVVSLLIWGLKERCLSIIIPRKLVWSVFSIGWLFNSQKWRGDLALWSVKCYGFCFRCIERKFV